MCGVIGYVTLPFRAPRPESVEATRRLLDQAKIRGLHAFGLVVPDDPYGMALDVRKAHTLPEIHAELESLASGPPRWLLAHTRYSTSGDWHDHRNNQPVVLPTRDGDSALVFNGVISMASKAEMEQELGEAMNSDNDGELFLRRWARGEDIPAYLKSSRASFAGLAAIVLNINGHRFRQVYAIRNERRPLWYALDRTGSAVYFASTRDIFTRSGLDVPPVPVPPNRLVPVEELPWTA